MFKHQGHSGFGLKSTQKTVTKWTKGSESSVVLLESFRKQMLEISAKKLSPLKTVEVYGFQQSEEYFEFTMPYLNLESGFTTSNKTLVKNLIIQSLRQRTTTEVMGFKGIIKHKLATFNDSKQKQSLLSSVEHTALYYPYGYTHGDMGFANMLVDDESVYMIDFTESFIHSPLLDIATLWLSSKSPNTKDWHKELVAEIMREYSRFKEHIDIIRRTLVLSYFRDSQTKEREKELLDLFYA